MAKLFNSPQEAVALEQDVSVHDQLPEAITEHSQSIDMALEASQMAIEHMQTVQGMHDSLTSQKLCSTAYLHTLEAYSPLVRSMGARMGVKSFPSLESFSNRHAAQDAHNYAVEGFKEMLSKIWERIKDFFRELFKKVKLFVRRLTGANLELDNYEKYCDQLVSKLKTNNAVIGDKSALISDLPRLLCDANGAPVDSDFVLNQGGAKIKNLINQMQTINYGPESTKLHKDIADFRAVLETYITAVSSKLGITQDVFVSSTEGIETQGINLLSTIFPYDYINLASLSPKVSEEISNRFAGRVNDSNLTYKSMVEDHSGGSRMPTGINMYLVTSETKVGDEPALPCVFIGTQYTGSIGNSLKPIAELNNLVRFHSDYKATLGKFNEKSGTKSVDDLSSEMDKLLNLLKQKFPTLVQATTVVPNNVTGLDGLVKLINQTKATPNSSFDALMNDTYSASVGSYGSVNPDDDSELAQVLQEFFAAYQTNDTATFNNAVKAVKDKGSIANPFIEKAIAHILAVTNSGSASISQEDMMARSKAVGDLQRLLTHVFSQLQTLYRCMMVEFYKVYTELRYAVIKYIFDSAKRYTY